MSALVCFTSPHGLLALPVAVVRGVVDHLDVVPLPAPAPVGVAGLLRPGREALPVLDVLGTDGRHLLLLSVGGRRFGLIAGEVTHVQKPAAGALGPSPAGPAGALIAGTLRTADGTVLVVDEHALAARLDRAS
ncbi:hypothetical protein DSM112329_03772 [Paraconexibacter sp. AEG42_29]|uniref:CheW-like domain-containing protein n=1 Tax=Paraconexibacter sp. AEG42_29 TaxID=2997339 RepID=A0AAU7AZ07_9ACTN